MKDDQIVALYWDRNEDAIRETARKYGAYLGKIAYNILSDVEDSEECVNDTWHRAWDTMPPQRPDCLRSYLGRIVRNLSISRLRQRTAQKRGGGLEVLLSELGDCLPSPRSVEQETEAKELAEVISAWLRTLSIDDRSAFIRRYWYAESVSDLAHAWGCTPNQMTKRLLRLRRALQARLEQEGMAV